MRQTRNIQRRGHRRHNRAGGQFSATSPSRDRKRTRMPCAPRCRPATSKRFIFDALRAIANTNGNNRRGRDVQTMRPRCCI